MWGGSGGGAYCYVVSYVTVSQYILSLNLSHPELTVNDFFAGRSQREQQVAVVKERGCNNMKSDKVKAAIADFTRAIRVWYV